MKVHACKYLLISGLVLSIAMTISAGNTFAETITPSNPVTIVDLSGLWDFAYMPGLSDTPPAPDRYKIAMPIPGCWDDTVNQNKAQSLWPDARFNPGYQPVRIPSQKPMPDLTLPFLRGSGWYRQTIDVPTDWQGRQVVLNLGYVVNEARIFINNRQIVRHTGCYTNWQVNLSKYLEFGRPNEILIAVDNLENGRGGCRVRGWKGSSAGIFDRVWLKVSGPARIADLYIYRQSDRLNWQVTLEGSLPQNAYLAWRIIDPKSTTAVALGSSPADNANLSWSTGTDALECWSDRSPNLYTIELSLFIDDKIADVLQQSFGMRRLTVHDRTIQLNGQPIYLRGGCEMAYFPETCTPPTDIDAYRQLLSRLKEFGFNWFRFHTWVPSEPYMQAADELGVMIQVEAPGMEVTMDEWRDVLIACRRHPSVVFYCGGNEALMEDWVIDILREWAAEQKRLVPDALFNPMQGERGITSIGRSDRKLPYQGFGPERVEDPIPYNPVRIQKIKPFSDIYGVYIWGDLSHNILAPGAESHWIDYRVRLYPGPAIAHELGILGVYINFDLEPRYENTRIGTDYFKAVREHLQKQGVYSRAERYFQNSAALQYLMHKDTLEMTRQCKTLSGYNYLGDIDYFWHRGGYRCGILNEFAEPRAGISRQDILDFNGESILMVSDQRNRNCFAKEPFTRTLFVSWYAPEHLENGLLKWKFVSSKGHILQQGRWDAPSIPTGRFAEIGDIGFLCPDLDTPDKMTLHVELTTPSRTIRNRWEYWIFPADNTIPSSDVIVTHELKLDTLAQLKSGARVVLLGHKPFPADPVHLKIGKAGRPHINLATVIEKHPLMDQFPHDGFCSWQFQSIMDMRDRSVAVVFNDLDLPFDPILEIVSSYKNVRKQAAIFEARVGSGALLVCSLNLFDADPAADYLRAALVKYAGSDRFNPNTVFPAKTLEHLIRNAAATQKEELPDQRIDPNVQPKKDSPKN